MFRGHTPIIRDIRCWVAAYGFLHRGADGAVRHHPHRTHNPRSSSQDHHPSKNSVQKTICCNSTSNAPDEGRMYPKHVELRIHQQNYLVPSSWHFTLFHVNAFKKLQIMSATQHFHILPCSNRYFLKLVKKSILIHDNVFICRGLCFRCQNLSWPRLPFLGQFRHWTFKQLAHPKLR